MGWKRTPEEMDDRSTTGTTSLKQRMSQRNRRRLLLCRIPNIPFLCVHLLKLDLCVLPQSSCVRITPPLSIKLCSKPFPNQLSTVPTPLSAESGTECHLPAFKAPPILLFTLSADMYDF